MKVIFLQYHVLKWEFFFNFQLIGLHIFSFYDKMPLRKTNSQHRSVIYCSKRNIFRAFIAVINDFYCHRISIEKETKSFIYSYYLNYVGSFQWWTKQICSLFLVRHVDIFLTYILMISLLQYYHFNRRFITLHGKNNFIKISMLSHRANVIQKSAASTRFFRRTSLWKCFYSIEIVQ